MLRRALVLLVPVLAALCALAIGSGAPAGAQGAEGVAVFDSAIEVQPDGSAVFVETIVYDFGSEERRGIFRDLVTAQRYDDDNDRYYPLTVESVASTTAPAEYVVLDLGGGQQRIRIGDPNVTITGIHEYVIRYRLGGVVNAQQGDDELYWNVTGAGWDVPIRSSSVTVTSPTGVGRVACFAGRSSSDACDAASASGSVAMFGHGNLDPGAELTVVVALTDVDGDATEPAPTLGTQEIEEPFSFAEAFEPTAVNVGGAGLLAVLFGGLIARVQWQRGRDRRAVGAPTDIAFAGADAPGELVPLFSGDGSPVEFVPPDGIRPGQLGVLRDETADTTDVSATIIDLAVRGYIRIEEIADDDGDVEDYRFVRLSKNGGLLSYEGYLLTELFDRGPEVELSSLKNTFASSLAEVKDQLYIDVVARGWFTARPDHVRVKWLLVGVGVEALGIGLTIVLALFTNAGLLGLPVVAAGLALMIGAHWMPRRTPMGHGLYRRVIGFEDFIENSEKHRAQWAERRHLFTEYLPYAIAFGATKQWARTLEGLGAPSPQEGGWYVGHSAYTWSAFGAQMGSFSSSAAATLSSTPGGSGGSGFGGGSSGGGGGGGGGGSW